MKNFLLAPLFLGSFSSLPAVKEGDTYRQVMEEKGSPSSKVEAAGTAILRYPDITVKLKDDRVVSVTASEPGQGTAPKNGTPNKPAPKPPAGTGAWTTDYTAALQQAKTDKRRVFLFFTGSDWCIWCKRLDAEVLTQQEFKDYAREKLILVKLDFPNDLPQTRQERARNEALSKKYGITGFPTVILLDDTGKVVGKMGYKAGGPKPYVEALKKI